MASLAQTLARNLKYYRKLRQLSQAELANRIGVSRQTIVNYETSATGISLETVAKIAKALGVEETELVMDATHQPKPILVTPSYEEAWAIVSEKLSGLSRERTLVREKTSPYKTPRRKK